MMHNYLLQQPPLPAAVNPAMAFQYPRLLGLLPSLGSLMNPPSFGAFLSRSVIREHQFFSFVKFENCIQIVTCVEKCTL
jgi:hypothetical protein